MFDEDTLEKIKDKNPAMIEAIIEGMKLRYEAKKMEDAANEMKIKANKLLAPVMVAADLKSLTAKGLGTLTFVQDVTTTSVNRKKMEKYLVERGVSATLISEAREAATSSRTSEYQVKFTAEG